jgi:hypothetical protein
MHIGDANTLHCGAVYHSCFTVRSESAVSRLPVRPPLPHGLGPDQLSSIEVGRDIFEVRDLIDDGCIPEALTGGAASVRGRISLRGLSPVPSDHTQRVIARIFALTLQRTSGTYVRNVLVKAGRCESNTPNTCSIISDYQARQHQPLIRCLAACRILFVLRLYPTIEICAGKMRSQRLWVLARPGPIALAAERLK